MGSHRAEASRITAPAGLSRRSALRGLGGGVAAGLVAAGLGPERSLTLARAQTPAAAPFLGETYVGGTSEPYLLAAVVIGAAAADGAAREARAYLCKTPVDMPGGIDEWLTGTLSGDLLDLQAESGVGLSGQLAEGAVTGTVTLADGTPIALLATRARGPAGLYIGARVNRLLQAYSAEGGYFEELVAAVPDETFMPSEHWPIGHDTQPFLATGLATPPAGAPVVLTTHYDRNTDSDQLRVILLNDGRHNGAGKDRSDKFSSRDVDW